MRKMAGYRILSMGVRLALILAMFISVAKAQQRAPNHLSDVELYCSGMVTDQAVPHDAYIASGEDSSYKLTFQTGNYVYINRGANQGVKVGDQFEVIRPEIDPNQDKWFKYQTQLYKAMGTMYADIGRLRVLSVQPKTATAEVGLSCDLLQRGDLIRPFQPRPTPTLHDVKFDPLAPSSGKKTAMVVSAKDFGTLAGLGSIVYVNLGSAQGVQAGNYFRVFRYQGTHIDTNYQVRDMAYKTFGFGSTPVAYQWDDLPRQVLGEGIVLRTGPNSSTVFLSTVRGDIYVGDYVELE
jgi:hypothetical protein